MHKAILYQMAFSFHYEPPSDEIAVNLKYIDIFTKILKEHNCTYHIGKVWTTDEVYQETRDKVNLRKSQGCFVGKLTIKFLLKGNDKSVTMLSKRDV